MLLDNREYMEQISCMIERSGLEWSRFDHKSVLITGAAGMLGSGMVDVLIYLNEHIGIRVDIYALGRTEQKIRERFAGYIDRDYFHIIALDISKEIKMEQQVDYLIHAASNADPMMMAKYPVDTLLANVIGMNNLLNLALRKGAERVLYVSSGEMYGQPDDTLVHGFFEGYCGTVDYSNPRSCYPSGKRAAEVLCQSYISQYDMDVVIVRPCHCYGPTMTASDSRAMSQFFRKVINGENIILKSDGTLRRSHCYVVDAVMAMYCVLLRGEKGEAYNIADRSSEADIRTVASLIAEEKGKKVVFDIPDELEKKGFSKVVRAVLDGSKLERLGWKPCTGLRDGVKCTIRILEEK